MKKILKTNKIDHIAIVVPDLRLALKHYESIFGLKASEVIISTSQKVKISYLNFSNIQLETIQPLDSDSPINKFLIKNPSGGLHHIGLEVDDINESYKVSEGLNLNPIEKPVNGHHGKPLFFLHPKKMMNLLFEILSKK